jgi:hypothetical protein
MNLLKPTVFVMVLALIGSVAGMLSHAKANQRLGLPGVRTRSLAGSQNLEVLLPEALPGYTSMMVPQAAVVTNMLPPDTSYGQRLYQGEDGFKSLANVVLMGSSRSSIHKPQVCLVAQGWTINEESSHEIPVHMERPVSYDLNVMRLVLSRQVEDHDQKVEQHALYVYWFVDADRLTASHAQRMLWMAHDVVVKNVLDRWAYVSFFAECAPGQEAAAFERIKRLIIAAVPEFQLVPPAAK